MDRRFFLSSFASAGLAILVPVRWGSPQPKKSRERVVYADPLRSHYLATQVYEELGRVDNGVWVSCPDQTVRVLTENLPPMFLYFDRRGYDLAIVELPAAKVQEVIQRRRDRWAPQAGAYVLSWLFDLERVRLEGALGVWDRQQVEQSLVLLQRLAGLERYQTVPGKAMAVTVLEGESQLLATLKSALETGILGEAAEDRKYLAAHETRRQVWAKTVGQVTAALGVPEFANTLPFADPTRGVFLHPVDQAFEQALSKSGEAAVRWRDGLVFVTAERRLESLRTQKRSVDILYADANEFYDSVESLTTAQLERDFSARHGRSTKEVGQDVLGQIDRLHSHQILMKRELCQRGDVSRVCQEAGVDRQLQEEVNFLGRSLARTRTFSRSQGLDSLTQPGSLLQTATEIVASDTLLLLTIAARHWPSVASVFSFVAE
jgi:hypothetical protein